MEYKDGKGYRKELGERPRQSSTPPAREVDPTLGGFPVHHRGGLAPHHVETVGWVNGEKHEATHPNADAKLHGNSGTAEQKAALGGFNRVHMKPKS
jgi:hypothetical protein